MSGTVVAALARCGRPATPVLQMMDKSFEQQVLSVISSVFDVYSAVLFVPDDQERQYRLAAHFSLGDRIDPEACIAPGKWLVGWIAGNNQPLLVDNLDQQRNRLGYYRDERDEADIKSFMGCPVPRGGALCVDSKRPYSFSDKEHKILQLFAQIVAHRETRPANEEFVGDIPRYFAELGIIQDLRNRCTNWTNFLPKFLKSMTDATGFDYGAFASLDYEGETYTVEAETERMFIDVGMALSLGSGIAGWVFRNGQDVMENDASATPLFNRQEGAPEFQSVVCLPLIIRKTTRGVFCLAHKERKAVDETMRSFLKQAVDHLALFLENMVLREWLRYALPKAEIHKEGQSAYDAGGRTGER